MAGEVSSQLPGYRPDDEATQPPYLYAAYRSTVLRSPSRALIPLQQTLSEIAGPIFGQDDVAALDYDLTRQHAGAPLGQRIIVTGRLLDGDGSPIPNSLVEIWQANAAGRYAHSEDNHEAPLDPNFTGGGRCLTDAAGHYRFVTIHPGAYPWANDPNAWRPAHIHFSVFGPAFATRLITQMYFPGDPLLPFDPILESIPDPAARHRLIASFDWDTTEAGFALGYTFDIVLRGPDATPIET
jgi:protocatechuate 3,4-dioxygenase beta subunit